MAGGHRLRREAPGERTHGVRPLAARLAAVPACAVGRGSLRKVGDRAPEVSEIGEAQQLVGRDPQRLAYLVNEREAWLHFRALVARVAVFLDPERFGEIAGPVEPALGSQRFQALREARTHLGRERVGHATDRKSTRLN